MTELETNAEATSAVRPLGPLAAATRVDTAHVRASAIGTGVADEANAALPGTALPEFLVGAAGEQVQLQAAQLAGHLQRQLAGLDHREAELNARLAAMENQLRSARLWLNERHAELAAQKSDLDRRERELALRIVESGVGPKTPRKKNRAVELTGEEALREAELDRREEELNALAEQLAERLAVADEEQSFRHAAGALAAKREQLERAERLLANEQADLERQRDQVSTERGEMMFAVQSERHKVAEESERWRAEQQRAAAELMRKTDELTARQAAIERLRADVTRVQQEGLEMRLATEELWARLCGSMAPAELSQSLAQIRLKLADEQRLARHELAEQRAEVERIAGQLSDQHEKLGKQREELQAWAIERQKDLERQATMLVANTEQWEMERAELLNREHDWHAERFRLQQEIRRLLAGSPRYQVAA